MEKELKGETMWRLLLSLEAPRNDRQSQNTVDREHAHFLSPLSEVRLSVFLGMKIRMLTPSATCASFCFVQTAEGGWWKKTYLTPLYHILQ